MPTKFRQISQSNEYKDVNATTRQGFGIFHAIFIACILLVSWPAYAETALLTVRGPVGWGSLDSGIDGLQPGCCVFLTQSEVARAIFNECGVDDDCEITGLINTTNWQILSITNVRKIDTSFEPSSKIIKDAACWAFSVARDKCGLSDSEVSVSIVHSAVKTIGVETRWYFSLKMTIKNTMHANGVGLGVQNVYLVRREDSWTYTRH